MNKKEGKKGNEQRNPQFIEKDMVSLGERGKEKEEEPNEDRQEV